MVTDLLAFQTKYRYKQQFIKNQEHRPNLKMTTFLVCAILLAKKLKLNLDSLYTGNGIKVDGSIIYIASSEDVIGTGDDCPCFNKRLYCILIESRY